MDIKPISLPSAGGIDYGGGDVRHHSEGDAIDPQSLQAPTRYLAKRDSIIADKINEIVQEVNVREMACPVILPRICVPANESETIFNYGIPGNFEARVLYANIASTPDSENIELEVLYSVGYGNSTGISVLNTSSGYPPEGTSGGTSYYYGGEFIIVIKNNSSISLDISCSLTLGLRTQSSTGVLAPAVTLKSSGPPGPAGPSGPPGPAGPPGLAGTSGIVYRGYWSSGVSYTANDLVSHDYGGSLGVSTYRAKISHISTSINEPNPSLTPSAQWDFFAQAGDHGLSGSTGTPGVPGVSGAAGGGVIFYQQTVNGTFTPGVGFVSGTTDGSYIGNISGSTLFPLLETHIGTSGGDSGVSSISASLRFVMKGNGTFTLPSILNNNSLANYSNDFTSFDATPHGSYLLNSGAGSIVDTLLVTRHVDPDKFIIDVINENPIKISVLIESKMVVPSPGLTPSLLTDTTLLSWALSGAYQSKYITYDVDEVVSHAVVFWPDRSKGTFEMLSKDLTHLEIKSYSITHENAGRIFTQPDLIRDSSGNVIYTPDPVIFSYA